jgi:hypothetical protein
LQLQKVSPGLFVVPLVMFPVPEHILSVNKTKELHDLFVANVNLKKKKTPRRVQKLSTKRHWFCGDVHLKNVGANPKKEDVLLLAVQKSIDVALQDFVHFMQTMYPLHVHVMKSLLISEANAPIQDRLHYDMHTGEEGKNPFSCIIGIKTPFHLRYVDSAESVVDIEVPGGWCVKFDSTVLHDGGANNMPCSQYRIQVKFAVSADELLNEDILTLN